MTVKNIICKIIQGAVIGIAIGFIMSVGNSTLATNYLPGPPELVNQVGMLTAAQMVLGYSALLGMIFSLSSLVWQQKSSLMMRTIVYYLVNLIGMSVVGYRLYFFSHNAISYLIFLLIYSGIFIIIWLMKYLYIQKSITQMNQKIKQMNQEA
ncbi:Protein of unknown function [Granulicatella balaenopterae]|uniref:DUF3021 domain-containing protein n=1 Tax=Granulicatella balaenopterae TaxID=137733 RepID=A0A1H9HFG4_9LACT|nr:DUF3021 domain-containing protein [Granulicatella balaenopterae]SEQ60956.1 Protein of unknown function [Granulicatella balaenopterae]